MTNKERGNGRCKPPALEDESELRFRIDEAARYAPIENMGISPQCGFASTVGWPLSAFLDAQSFDYLAIDAAGKLHRSARAKAAST